MKIGIHADTWGIQVSNLLKLTLRTTRLNIRKFCTLITLNLCVLCVSQNKQQTFPYTTLTDWILW